jgi:hypothetical protein
MGVVIPSAHLSELEQAGRPLLRLVQHITGMETRFITAIDCWYHSILARC